MEIIEAFRPLGPVGNGVTKPFFVACENGETYVVKFKENPEGPRVLANEYVCAKIAEILELPLASPALIKINSALINDFGDEISNHIGETVSEGIHFGTKKIKKTFTITNHKMIDSAANAQIVPEVLLFDQLICNVDRDQNAGNLLFDASTMNIIVIDHTHVFDIGAIWDHVQLQQRIGQDFISFDQYGRVFEKLVHHVKGNNPFHGILNKMSGMTRDQLWHIINSIPDEWEVNGEDKRALLDFLCDRLQRIPQALNIMKPKLPFWKGGS